MEHNSLEHRKSFGITNLSLKNKTSVYLLAIMALLGGFFAYNALPKEAFPEVKMPQVHISTIYPGNTPKDVENLITKPLEKKIRSVESLKKLTSTSIQGYSSITAHFEGDIDIDQALIDVKDAVDKAKSELPTDLQEDPAVAEINFSKIPIVNVNLSGDYSINTLKDIAEVLKDKFEAMSQIDEVSIRGALEREIQVLVDLPLMELNQVTFRDIETSIINENISISGGKLKTGVIERTIRVIGQFKDFRELEQIIVKKNDDKIIYLKDIAQIKDSHKEINSYARLNNQSVVSIDIIKRPGENILSSIEEIKSIVNKAKETSIIFPDITVTYTNDQSIETENQISNLMNSIIMGVLLVILVLQFFIGTKNALFVGAAIPLSMLISFFILSFSGVSLNMVVLFALVLALGMLVDNGIVTVENIHRLVEEGFTPTQAARIGVGEIAWPIIASTATTIAAFFPLLFWNDMMGKFMYYIPFTLIVVLSSSLFVALVINPVLASTLIKKEEKKSTHFLRNLIIMLGTGIIFYIIGAKILGGLLISMFIISVLSKYVLAPSSLWFQNVLLVKLETKYTQLLSFSLKGKRPLLIFISGFVLLILSFIIFGASNVKTVFFPSNEPDYINIFIELPEGTNISKTNQETKYINAQVDSITKQYREAGIIRSITANVGSGTSDPGQGPQPGNTPNKARITVDFQAFENRKGYSTSNVMRELTKGLSPSIGTEITVAKNENGPPTGKPISIEVNGEDFNTAIEIAENIKKSISDLNIPGIEALKFDITTSIPELRIEVDRLKATQLGISTIQIGSVIRTAMFGKEVSKYKVGKEDYDITIKLKDKYRTNLPTLLNQKIIYRNQKNKIVEIPISSVVKYKLKDGLGMINHYNRLAAVSVQSNVIEGYNANEINTQIKAHLEKNFSIPSDYTYRFSGEQEDQAKTFDFLSKALLIAVCLILLIMVFQFNSVIKPLIIIVTVIFSFIGVFLGFAIFQMTFSVIMTGIGIISLAGIVVNNTIVLIDCIDLIKSEKKQELGLERTDLLPYKDSTEFAISGGVKRLRPVLLTAITTVFGLIPLAIGFNIDFTGLLTHLSPNIYWGGNNAIFWGPMAWTIIFGLTFATVLTLIMIPVIYIMLERVRNKVAFKKNKNTTYT